MCSEAMLPDDDYAPREDEIVADVRAARERLAAAVSYDFDRHWAQLEALEAEERARGRRMLGPAVPQSGAAA